MPLPSSAPSDQLGFDWPRQSGSIRPSARCFETQEGRAFFDPLVEQLVAARRKRGLRQEDVDARIGCAERLVSKWECGIRRPSAYFLLLWTQALDVRLTVTMDDN